MCALRSGTSFRCVEEGELAAGVVAHRHPVDLIVIEVSEMENGSWDQSWTRMRRERNHALVQCKANSAPVFTGRKPIGAADKESAWGDVGLGAWRPLLLAATVVDILGVRPALLSQPRRFRLDALATM